MSNLNLSLSNPSSLGKSGTKSANSVYISDIHSFLNSVECKEDFFISLNYSMSEADLEYFINWLMQKSFWAASYKALEYKINYDNTNYSTPDIGSMAGAEPIKKILPLLEQSDFSNEYKKNQMLQLLKNKDWTQKNLIQLIESKKFTIFTSREIIDLSIKNNFAWTIEHLIYLLESKSVAESDKKYLLDFFKNNNFDYKQKNSILLVGATNQENLGLIKEFLGYGAKASDRVRQTLIEAIYKNNYEMFQIYEAALIEEGAFNDENKEAVINACISRLNHHWLIKILSGNKASDYRASFTHTNKSLSLVLSFQESYDKYESNPKEYSDLKIVLQKLIKILIDSDLISIQSTYKGLPAIFKNCTEDFKQLMNHNFVPYYEKSQPKLISKSIAELVSNNSPGVSYWIEAISSSTQKGQDILQDVLAQKSQEAWPSLLLHHLEDLKAACSEKEKLEIEQVIAPSQAGKIIKI